MTPMKVYKGYGPSAKMNLFKFQYHALWKLLALKSMRMNGITEIPN